MLQRRAKPHQVADVVDFGSVGGTTAPAEHLAPGDEVTMLAGDALFFGPEFVHTVRNEGDKTTVLLISAILAADQPPVIFHHERTPAP